MYKRENFLIVFILALLIIPTVVNADTINSVDMNIYINSSGNARVTEVWDVKATKKTEYYHSYKNLGNSTIKNLRVSDEDREYELLQSWNINGSFEAKKYKCGLNYVNDGIEICWGKSEYGNKKYIVEYEITNFVSSLEDSQMAYWTLIPKGHDKFNKASIEIKSDFMSEDTLNVVGYGNSAGTCDAVNGTIKMSTNGKKLSSNEYMTILIKFPEGTFDTNNYIYENFAYYLEKAKEEIKKYNLDNYYKFMLVVICIACVLIPITIVIIIKIVSKSSTNKKYYLMGLLLVFYGYYLKTFSVSFVGIIIILIYMLKSYMDNTNIITIKDKKKIKKAEYYRDIPCDNNLFKAYYIATTYGLTKNKTDFLGVLLLKWLKEKKVSTIKNPVGKLNREEVCIKFNSFESGEDFIAIEEVDTNKRHNYYEEKELFNYMLQASQDGILERKELERWCGKNYKHILDWFKNTLDYEKNELIKKGYAEEKFLNKLSTKGKVKHDIRVLGEAVKLAGLKKYLKDYTSIHDREAIEVELFEEYLIYAQMFGIAKKVMKEFNELYPNMIEQSNFSSFDNVNILISCASVGMSSANYTKNLYSGGSGGFSSGGGGSFGGGGRNG